MKIIGSLAKRTAAERSQLKENARKLVLTGNDEQRTAAALMLDALDRQDGVDQAALMKHIGSLSPTERVVVAFRDPVMTESERAIVQILLDNPGASSSQLSSALGWQGQSWHMHFGSMCSRRAARLWPAPPAENRDADFYTGILADFDDDTRGFTMKPKVVAGFAALGLRAHSR